MNMEISVLSLNTFGIPFYLSLSRLARIATKVVSYDSTIICLQEIQQNAYVNVLSDQLKSYPYQVIYPHVYAPKGGLGTFSRLPLSEAYFEPYKDRGLRWLITFSDWALFKGILVTHVQSHGLDIVTLNTHLNANYTGDWRRSNPLASTQYRQIQQLTKLLRRLPDDFLIILCGDFNFPRNTFLYEELVAESGLIDPLHGDPRPSYHPFPLVPSLWKTSLDYMFLRLPQDKEFLVQPDVLTVEDHNQTNPLKRFLTDHCALTIKVGWTI